ncbi:RNA-directed DNA polymerase, eukaryota, reverse transcriptase zinc-binding domain protein [Tanacetum coccineum]
MRPKRTVKPTQIFDNSVNISSRNKNKQKNSTKKNKNDIDPVNATVDDDDNGEMESGIDKEVNNGSLRSDEEDSSRVNQKKVKEESMGEDKDKQDDGLRSNVDDEVLIGMQDDETTREANSGVGTNSCTSPNVNTHNVINSHCENHANDSNEEIRNTNDKQTSYASSLTKSLFADGNKLFTIPTSINSKGEKVVLFDEELVMEGCDKWKLTVCGYFFGCKMHVNVLKYNIRRMWTRFGLEDIVVDSDEMCYFKFKDEEGMKYIIDQSPWIVNGKHLNVQKWDPEVVIEKETPCKIHVWIRLYNVPLKAWSIKGISAISSRVLVEVDAGKRYLDKIEINYVDAMNKVKMTKWVRVEYSWKPDKCDHCNKQGYKGNVMNIQQKYVVKQKLPESNCKEGDKGNPINVQDKGKSCETCNDSKRGEDMLEFDGDVCQDDRIIVDRYILRKMQPPPEEIQKWTYDMQQYFKFKWNYINRMEDSSDEEDILEENDAANDLVADETGGGDFNVTLNAAEHSSGSFGRTIDMVEFSDTINSLEVEDICSIALKVRLKSIQADVDKNPHDANLKNEAVLTLNEYVEAAKDEMKILHQKAKVKWLKEEDKNTAFFHGIIKSKRRKNRVEYIKDDDGVSYEGEAVPKQFVKHFENFFREI